MLFARQLSPSTIQSPSAAAEDTSVLMHHLAEELSDLPTPPPARLQSRLLRWRSEDRGKERWKGVVEVLRVQSQVTRERVYIIVRMAPDDSVFPRSVVSARVLVLRKSVAEVKSGAQSVIWVTLAACCCCLQLRRTVSMAHRPRARSLGNRPAEPALLHTQSSE